MGIYNVSSMTILRIKQRKTYIKTLEELTV